MEQSRENKMGTTPVLELIVKMSLPAMFSMLIQSLYNVVDSIFVARYSADGFTAVSLAFPVQTLMIAVAVGTGVGLNSLVSRRLGERRQQEADHAASHAIPLALLSWLAFAILGALGTRAFFEAYTKTTAVVEMGCQYVYIVTIVSIGLFVSIALEKVIQSTGNMILPMLSQLIGAVTNIIFDPIMIFGLLGFPEWGVAGAAAATVLGQIFAAIFMLVVTFTRSHAVKVQLRGFRFRRETVKDIYAVGFPSIVMQAISSVMVTCLNAILIGFSEAAVSVLGVYYKLQSFVFMPVFGLTQGIMPIMGYNYGARQKARLLQALRYGMIIAVGVMAAGMVIFWALPEQLLALFDATPEMLRIGVPALRYISLCFVPAAAGLLFSTIFQATGQGYNSLFISALRQLVVVLPVAWLLSQIGLVEIWFAFPIAEVVALLAGVWLFSRLYRSHIRAM